MVVCIWDRHATCSFCSVLFRVCSVRNFVDCPCLQRRPQLPEIPLDATPVIASSYGEAASASAAQHHVVAWPYSLYPLVALHGRLMLLAVVFSACVFWSSRCVTWRPRGAQQVGLVQRQCPNQRPYARVATRVDDSPVGHGSSVTSGVTLRW